MRRKTEEKLGQSKTEGMMIMDLSQVAEIISDNKRKPQVRAKLLYDTVAQCMHSNHVDGLLDALTEFIGQLDKDRKASGTEAKEELAKLTKELESMVVELRNGGLRIGTFLKSVPKMPIPRAMVSGHNGDVRLMRMHPDISMSDLEIGDTVYTDPAGAIVLYKIERELPADVVTFARWLPDINKVEVRGVNDSAHVYDVCKPVSDAINSGALKHGDKLIACHKRELAFMPLLQEVDRRYRFVDKSRISDINVGRDIGAPHWILDWLVRRTRILMFNEDLCTRFGLRPRVSVMMSGPSGTGKTLTIKAYIKEFSDMLDRAIGTSDQTCSRVVRAKVSELLSEWLGRSDKNIDAFFDDVLALGLEEVALHTGEKKRLPVVVILEEAEGLSRRRGDFDGCGGVYDRILGTMLQRLDDPMDELSKIPLVWITTSNRPDLIDSAMWRRFASVQARFGRLDRVAFEAVLDKKLKEEYPYAEPRDRILQALVGWLYPNNGNIQEPVVELVLHGGKKLPKYYRDFLTGGLVENAVAAAIDTAVLASEDKDDILGLAEEDIRKQFEIQIVGLAHNLTPENVAEYVDLPSHAHVATISLTNDDHPHR